MNFLEVFVWGIAAYVVTWAFANEYALNAYLLLMFFVFLTSRIVVALKESK